MQRNEGDREIRSLFADGRTTMSDSKTVLYNILLWVWDDLEGPMPRGSAQEGHFLLFSQNGFIVETGLWSNGARERFADANLLDGNGSLVLPGLVDAHIHCAGLGESNHLVDLANSSLAEMTERIKAHMKVNETLSWIIGTHWDQDSLGAYPSRHDLDKIETDKPILLWRACWHIGVLNTKALEACGIINGETGELFEHFVQPEGGVIDLDEDGSPSGILRERAMESVISAMGKKSTTERLKFIKEGMALCVSSGLTAIQTNDEGSYAIYQALAKEEGLPLRVFLTPTQEEICGEEDKEGEGEVHLLPFLGRDHSLGDRHVPRLVAERVKIFSDGSLGAETAAIRKVPNQPLYFDGAADTNRSTKMDVGARAKEMTGVLIHETSALMKQISDALRKSWRLEIHAIGDASAEQVLWTLEEGYKEQGLNISEGRPVLTHCQVLGADLIEIMARNGVIANVQPSFVPTDMAWVQRRLSPSHLEYAYCWRTLMQRGIVVAGGSDAPIESCNPFTGLYDAIFRKDSQGRVFRESECLTFAEALCTYTINAAKAAGPAAEAVFGRLEAGFAADFVLCDEEVLSNPEKLLNLTPRLVVVGGVVEFRETERATERAPQRLEGPFIPGKNGRRRSFLQCDCCRVR